jgi:hypothetical protein
MLHPCSGSLTWVILALEQVEKHVASEVRATLLIRKQPSAEFLEGRGRASAPLLSTGRTTSLVTHLVEVDQPPEDEPWREWEVILALVAKVQE